MRVVINNKIRRDEAERISKLYKKKGVIKYTFEYVLCSRKNMKKLSKKVLGNMKKGNGIKTYVVMVVLFFVLAILSYANIVPWFVKYILLGAFALYLLKGYFEMHKNDEDLLD